MAITTITAKKQKQNRRYITEGEGAQRERVFIENFWV